MPPVYLRSAENDYTKNIGPSVRYHSWPQALPPDSEYPKQNAKQHDSSHLAHPFVQMANAEYNRLEKHGPPGAACDRLKLLLKIAAKG